MTSCHHRVISAHSLWYSHRPQLSTNQRTRSRSRYSIKLIWSSFIWKLNTFERPIPLRRTRLSLPYKNVISSHNLWLTSEVGNRNKLRYIPKLQFAKIFCFHLLLESEERIPWLQGLNHADTYGVRRRWNIKKTTGNINGYRHVLVCLESYFVLRQSNKQANTQ